MTRRPRPKIVTLTDAAAARVKEIVAKGDKPYLRRSFRLRNPYIDPLHAIQIRLLRELRAAGDDADLRSDVEQPLLLTISGIAAGMRNTG